MSLMASHCNSEFLGTKSFDKEISREKRVLK